jgi:hypothetical protein
VIQTDGFKTLTEGESVAYEVFIDDKGAKARNVQRLGRYHRTLQPGMNFVVPFVDRVCPVIRVSA